MTVSVSASSDHTSLSPLEEAAAAWMHQASASANNRSLLQWIATRPDDAAPARPSAIGPARAKTRAGGSPAQRAPFLLAEARRRRIENGKLLLTDSERDRLERLARFLPGDGVDDCRRVVRTHLRSVEHAVKGRQNRRRLFDGCVDQAARLVAGMAEAVLAAHHLDHSGWKPKGNRRSLAGTNPLPPGFAHHAANCVQKYHAAWPLEASALRHVEGSPFRQQPDDTRVDAAVKELFGNQAHAAQVGDLATTTDILTLHRLLAWLLGEAPAVEPLPKENRDGSYRVDLSLLAACQDGHGAIDRGTVVSAASRWDGFFVDPVAMGLTLLDARFLSALTIGWRCCRSELQSHRPRNLPLLALSINVEPLGSGSLLLEGGSAGALFACGMMGAAERRPIDVRESATMALRLTNPQESLPPKKGTPLADPDDLPLERPGSPDETLDAKDVFLGLVAAASLPAKLNAARDGNAAIGQAPLRTVLVADGQPYGPNEWPWPGWVHDPQHEFGELKIVGVRTLAEAYARLQADALIEDVVQACAKRSLDDWDNLRGGRAAQVGGENHKLDVFVPPHLKVQREDEPQGDDSNATGDRFRRLDGGLDELIERHLLKDDRRIVLTEDAGAGKTVFTWWLRERLSRWESRPFLVLRVEGTWPPNIRKALEDAVGADCRRGLKPKTVIDELLAQRRIVILVDALDQARKSDIDRFEEFLRDETEGSLARQLRYVVTSRDYKVREREQNLFRTGNWLGTCLDLFDETQQNDYRDQWTGRHAARAALWKRLVPDPKAVADLVCFPVVLRMIREILELAEPDGSDLTPFHNRGDLYWSTAERLVLRAFKAQGREESVERVERLIEVIACVAIEMMLTTRPDHGCAVPKELISNVLKEARGRFSGTAKDWRDGLRFLADTPLTERCLFEGCDKRNLSFRSLKMLEFFAGVFLAKFATAGIADELRPFVGSEQWEWPWRFAIELSEMRARSGATVHDDAALAASLVALLGRPEKFARPNELIWRAWPWVLEKAGVFEPPPLLVPGEAPDEDANETSANAPCEKWSPSYEEPLDRATYLVQNAAWDAVRAVCDGIVRDDADRDRSAAPRARTENAPAATSHETASAPAGLGARPAAPSSDRDISALLEAFQDGTLQRACRTEFGRLLHPHDEQVVKGSRRKSAKKTPPNARELSLDALHAFLSEYPLILRGLPVGDRETIRFDAPDPLGLKFLPPTDAAATALAREHQAGYRRCPGQAAVDDEEWERLLADVAAAAERGEKANHPLLRCRRGDDSDLKPNWTSEPVHDAQLDAPFDLHQHPMTNAVYALFDPRHFDRFAAKPWNYESNSPEAECPVIHVDFHDAWASGVWFQARLPTEAESEFAARAQRWAGKEHTTRYLYWFESGGLSAQEKTEDEIAALLMPHAWFNGNCGAARTGGRMQKVGAPGHANAWGISDPTCHVLTWCRDGYDHVPVTHVEAGGGPDRLRRALERVVRGGNRSRGPAFARTALRIRYSPESRNFLLGFRLASVRLSGPKQERTAGRQDHSGRSGAKRRTQ